MRKAIHETITRAKQKNELNNAMENMKKQDAATKKSKVVRGHKTRKQLPEIIFLYIHDLDMYIQLSRCI